MMRINNPTVNVSDPLTNRRPIDAAAVIDPKVAAAARAQGKTANPSWVYLAVPIFWANNGGLGVAGPPAFVPAPIAPDGGGGFNYAVDDEAATSAHPDLENFFRAWGASDAADLAALLGGWAQWLLT